MYQCVLKILKILNDFQLKTFGLAVLAIFKPLSNAFPNKLANYILFEVISYNDIITTICINNLTLFLTFVVV